MEKIELRIKPATLGFHGHLFIIYTNNRDEEFIVRGGPGKLSILDDIDVETGSYTSASRDWKTPGERSAADNRLLEEGPDLESKFLKMAFFAQLVEQSTINYDTIAAALDDDSDLIVNSNTLVAAALASAGITISEKDLPTTAKRLPPAGFENTSAFQKRLNAFFAKNYGYGASQGERKFKSIYDRLEMVYMDRYRGKLSEISNFTNGHGSPEYPRIIFEGINWRATENHIREKFKEDPKLAASILAELATARTLKGEWETEFRQKFGDYVVFENSPAGEIVTRESISSAPSTLGSGQPADAGNSGAPDINPDERASIVPEQQTNKGEPGRQMPAGTQYAETDPAEDRFARKTSYDTYRKLGRTPEEEQEALEHYEDLRRESYIDTGNIHMAEELAGELFKLKWDRSVFAIDDGTVMKYPVEKAYVDPEKDGHGYVRADVEALLASEGIRARKWYLEPNGKTERDLAWGSMDRDGYGPRMTLSYDDEAGRRHVLTEAFQAHVNGARQRQLAAREKADRELAKAYGLEWPDTSGLNPFEAARKQLMHAARLPNPDQMAADKQTPEHAAGGSSSPMSQREILMQPVPEPKPDETKDNLTPATGHQGRPSSPETLLNQQDLPVPSRKPGPITSAL